MYHWITRVLLTRCPAANEPCRKRSAEPAQIRARRRRASRSRPSAAADREISALAVRWNSCQRYHENGAKWLALRASTEAYQLVGANPRRLPSTVTADISAVSASGPSSG